ncbi:transposase domain-containing protein [Methylopila sp. 73B]|uniref:transposase domain-containing protein n=1 Tax=Methylopila sp. 73B TaxID=1120792 RepID=UPI00037C25B6|nr:transposase domain-containing protein [Methylopila sp. 73B]
MREWVSVAEIIALRHPALPEDRRGVDRMALERGWRADAQRAQLVPGRGREGGEWRYHVSLLPLEVRSALLAAGMAEVAGAAPQAAPESPSKALWDRFERLPQAQKDEARRRLAAVDRVEVLSRDATRQVAVATVAAEVGVSIRTLYDWLKVADDVHRGDRLAALAPKHAGRTATADCDPRAWDFLVALWLQPEQRVFDSCDRRMREAAVEHGWSPIPSSKTLKRRLDRDIPRAVQVLARKGADAAKALYPHQTRDRTVFHAMEAVNADGHMFDVFVKWADGTIARPTMVAVQDLYSGVIVGHRLARSENWTAVRHAFADAIESFGVPEQCWLDNGRAFASKWLTGGSKTRFRFKIRDDEPAGILTSLGVKVHFATPYHGQAKPIERAFRDLCEEIAKHPTCAGAYTGNSPMAKPDNYGSKAVPEEAFRALVATEIRRHNERQGRRTKVAAGRSFFDAFKASLENGALVRKATAAQRRLFLMAAEGVTARKNNGEIQLAGNRYWADPMSEFAGRKVIARFDPEDLLLPIAVYATDGRFICEASCFEAEGFNDMAAAQDHARLKRAWLRAQREMLSAERRLSISDVAALIPTPTPEPLPTPSVVRLVANGEARPVEPIGDQESWSGSESFSRAMRMLGDSADVLPFGRKD